MVPYTNKALSLGYFRTEASNKFNLYIPPSIVNFCVLYAFLPDEQIRILCNSSLQNKSLEILLDKNQHNFMSCVKKWRAGRATGDKIWNKLWGKLDKDDKGYIETYSKLHFGIGALLLIQKAIVFKKENGDIGKFVFDKDDREKLMEHTKHVAIWIIMKYGQRQTIGSPYMELMTLRLTKIEFRTRLHGWLEDYADKNEMRRLDDGEKIKLLGYDTSDEGQLKEYLRLDDGKDEIYHMINYNGLSMSNSHFSFGTDMQPPMPSIPSVEESI